MCNELKPSGATQHTFALTHRKGKQVDPDNVTSGGDHFNSANWIKNDKQVRVDLRALEDAFENDVTDLVPTVTEQPETYAIDRVLASRLINEAHDALPILGRASSLEHHQKAAMKLQMQEKEGEIEELRRRLARVQKAGD